MKTPVKWGWYQQKEQGYKFNPSTGGVDFARVTELEPGKLSIKYGNDFGDAWIDHNTVPANTEWYFWDNPQIPHLLYPNPANPKGAKDWIRLVPYNILTQTHTQSGTSRINDLLTEFAGRSLTWEEVVDPKPVKLKRSRRVLLCPSSPNCYTYYYNTTYAEWVQKYTTYYEQHGYEVLVRSKPTRKYRHLPQGRLAHQLEEDQILFTVSQHSVSAIESILAGVPAVVTGPHCGGLLATPWGEDLRTPDQDQVYAWVDTLLGDTRHKIEMWEGTWKK